ncbi:MAG: CapA family protein [Candidatus Harrisonbacteria bacterium]|nr:CapA family protein [Candidatus Harrisonbacteria bacterium]
MTRKKLITILTAIVAVELAAAIIFISTGGFRKTTIVRDNEPNQHTVLFVGDIMLDRAVREKIEANQDPLFPFLHVSDELSQADVVFGNLEGPITAGGTKSGSEYSFRFEPVGTLNALLFGGFDVLSLANNHIFDYGQVGMLDTFENLEKAGIQYLGAGSNHTQANDARITFFEDGTGIAWLGYTNLYPKTLEATATAPGISDSTLENIVKKIEELKADETIHLIVVSYHWGEEYEKKANKVQQDIAHALVDAGADLVIGHHPHVVQKVEKYKDAYIAYSLGNFVFDQSFSKETMEGLMLKAIIEDQKIVKIEEIDVSINDNFQPELE